MHIIKSRNKLKKYDAIFDDGTIVSFGGVHPDGRPYGDYTTGTSDAQREAYIARHSAMEDFNKYKTAGSLSYWILWNTRDIEKNLNIYRKRFNLSIK